MPSDPPKPPAPPNGPAPGGPRFDEEVDVKIRPKSVTPRRYKVIFHNDDYTTQEFVTRVLISFFHKSEAEATHIMLKVHRTGSGVAGVYTRDVAETKVAQVMDYAKEHGMPLLVTAEPESE